jgi:hypothetical protein
MAGNFMEWDVNYAGLDVDLITDYCLTSICLYKSRMSAAILVQGTQTLNNNVINLKTRRTLIPYCSAIK